MYGGTFGPALLASAPTAPDSWLTAINVTRALIAVMSLGVFVSIGLFLRKRQRQLDAVLREVTDDHPLVTLPDDGQTITVYAKKSGTILFIVQITLIAGVMNALLLWVSSGQAVGLALGAFLDLFFGLFLLLAAARLISRVPVLIVNAEGITDNATLIATGVGLIPWREIVRLYIYDPGPHFRILSTRGLSIEAYNQTILHNQALWKRILLALTWSPYGLVRVPEFLLPMPLEEVCAQIEEYLRIHGHTLLLSRTPAGADTSTTAD